MERVLANSSLLKGQNSAQKQKYQKGKMLSELWT